MADLLPEPTYAEALIELARLSRWPRDDVREQPRDASWQAYAWVAKCRRVVEAGER